MKAKIFYLLMLVFIFAACSADISDNTEQTVTFLTTIDCDKCKTKLYDNFPHEPGIADMKVEVPEKLVTITFDTEKNSIEKLIKLFNDLGYEAEVKK